MAVQTLVLLWIMGMAYVPLAVFAQQPHTDIKKNFESLTPGTSMEAVRTAVGSPTRVEPFKLIFTQTGDTAVCWYYAVNDWTLIFVNKYLDRAVKNRDTFLQKLQEWSNPKNQEGIRIVYVK